MRSLILSSLLLCSPLLADGEKNNPSNLAKSISVGNALFAFELQDELTKEDNLVFSPFSISSALAMCAAGAKGETFNQMRHVLHLPSTGADIDLGFKALFSEFSSKETPPKGVLVDLAQGIFMSSHAKFLPL